MNNPQGFKVGEIVQLDRGEPMTFLAVQLNGRISVLTDEGKVEEYRAEELRPYVPREPTLKVL